MTGLGLLWLARSRNAWPATLAGGVFLTLHALVHVWDTLAARESLHQLLLDIPAVAIPAPVVLWLAWTARKEGAES